MKIKKSQQTWRECRLWTGSAAPQKIADRLPINLFDPYPGSDDTPLPEAPALTAEQYEEMAHALDSLHAFGETFQQWCDRHYDQARTTGLIA